MITKKIKHKDSTGVVHEYDIGADAKNISEDTTHRFVSDEEKEEWSRKMDPAGNASDSTVAFKQAASRENISTGEKMAGLFGKIAKWFADLKNHAFSDLIQNATTADTTRAVSAAVAKILQDQITAQNTKNVPEYLESVGNVSPPAVNNGYSYATVPNLRTYRRLSIRAWVGDTSNYRIAAYPPLEKNREFIVSAYASPNYNGRIGVLIDTDNNRIGVRAIALTGYAPSQCGIGTFVAEK